MKLRVALVMTLAMVMGAIFVLATTTDATAAAEIGERWVDDVARIVIENDENIRAALDEVDVVRTIGEEGEIQHRFSFPPLDVVEEANIGLKVGRFVARWAEEDVPSEYFATVVHGGFSYQGELARISEIIADEETGLWGGVFTGIVERVDLSTSIASIEFIERGQ